MKQISVSLWNKLGSIQLTVVLSLLLTVDLAVGSLCLERHTTLFSPLNDTSLSAWIGTYGINNLSHTLWFFALLILLALLCINTFICTTDRVVVLIRSRKHFTLQRIFFRSAPHLMHYAMIITLAGYLCSYLFSQVIAVCTLTPGASMTLPGRETVIITLESFEPLYYRGERLDSFKNRVITPQAWLRLSCGSRQEVSVSLKEQNSAVADRRGSSVEVPCNNLVESRVLLTYNSPVRFRGYGIFMKGFSPDKEGGMASNVRIDMTIRRDPGVHIYLAGILFFTAGLAIYMCELIFFKNLKRGESRNSYGKM